MLHPSLMVFYLIPAAFVFFIALQAFLEDASTPKTHFDSWVMLVIAAMLWPITLPAITTRLTNTASRGDTSNDSTRKHPLVKGNIPI